MRWQPVVDVLEAMHYEHDALGDCLSWASEAQQGRAPFAAGLGPIAPSHVRDRLRQFRKTYAKAIADWDRRDAEDDANREAYGMENGGRSLP